MELPEAVRIYVSRHGEETDIEIRTLGGNLLPMRKTQTVIGPGPEEVDRQQLELAADLVQTFHW